MSRDVLRGEHPHTYLDDLESFYYVLSWMVAVHSGPSLFTGYRPAILSLWDYPNAETHKQLALSDISILTRVEPWFGAFFHGLLCKMHDFFRDRRPEYCSPPSDDLDSTRDYGMFLSHIRETLELLEVIGPDPAPDLSFETPVTFFRE
jgi:hypothetical protein